jgi:hypothetical protein
MKVEILDSDWWDLKDSPLSFFHLELGLEKEKIFINIKIIGNRDYEIGLCNVFGEKWNDSKMLTESSKYYLTITKLMDEIDKQYGINIYTPSNFDNPKLIGFKFNV